MITTLFIEGTYLPKQLRCSYALKLKKQIITTSINNRCDLQSGMHVQCMSNVCPMYFENINLITC